MDNRIIISVFGLIIGYLVIRFLNKKQGNSINVSSDAQECTISDILTNDKYKVKGQWGR